MRRFAKINKALLVAISLFVLIGIFVLSTSHSTIDYNTQVKPILNNRCITCHGGVKKQGGFSVLFRSEALAKVKSGKYAIIPGDPDNSEMIRRINLKDPEERMPYQHPPLSENEIETLTRWVKQGAKWGDHWAYVPVQKVEAPKPESSFFGLIPATKIEWIKNDIDYFIYEKLQEQKLKPSDEADKATLLRRVSLDLIGLPPSQSLAKQFLQNNSDTAYDQLVDSLLSSLHYA